ncbi:MAG: dockerin type I repeat-containing protein [Clostridia bacterium]|nr:dockerin type I repeat-containing protein [Clostridia bacterium]
MKKNRVLAVFLAVLIAAGSAAAIFAWAESVPVLGDPDGDGEVTASDARTALRIAIKADTAESGVVWACDVDGDPGVTSADARYILRYALDIEKFFVSRRFGEEEDSSAAADAAVTEGDEYYITGKFKTSADTAYEPFAIAVKGSDVYASTHFEDITVAILSLNGELYLISLDREDYCIVDESSARILDSMGLSAKEMTDAMASLTDVVKQGEPSQIYETDRNGMHYLVKVFEEPDGGTTLLWYLNGALVAADLYGSDGNLDCTLVFDEIRDTVPENLICDPAEYGYTQVNFGSFAVEMLSIKNADILALLDSLLNLKDVPDIGEEEVTVISISDIVDSLVPAEWDDTIGLIADAIPADVDDIDDLLPERLSDFIDAFPSDVDDIFDLVPDSVVDPIIGFFDAIDGFAAALPDTVDGFADGIIEAVSEPLSGITGGFSDILDDPSGLLDAGTSLIPS